MEGEHIQQRLDRLSAQKERVKIKLSQALIKYADVKITMPLYEDVLTDGNTNSRIMSLFEIRLKTLSGTNRNLVSHATVRTDCYTINVRTMLME